MSDRDKFLTEAIAASLGLMCVCENNHPLGCYVHPSEFPDFSTWQGFGKLWGWVVDQEWLEDFLNIMDVGEYIKGNDSFTFDIQKEFINPDRFATAIYEYLKPKETP